MSRDADGAGQAASRGSTRSGKRRPIRTLVVLCVAAVVIIGFGQKIFDLAFNPWAISVTGGPTLTGVWAGELRLAPNDVRQAVLRMDRRTHGARRCRGCKKIDGWMDMCVANGQTLRYTVLGDPDNWRGTRFTLDLSSRDPRPGPLLELGRANGEWDGEDVIRLAASPKTITVNPDGSATGTADTGSTTPQITIEMRRTSEDTPNCRK